MNEVTSASKVVTHLYLLQDNCEIGMEIKAIDRKKDCFDSYVFRIPEW